MHSPMVKVCPSIMEPGLSLPAEQIYKYILKKAKCITSMAKARTMIEACDVRENMYEEGSNYTPCKTSYPNTLDDFLCNSYYVKLNFGSTVHYITVMLIKF